MPAQQMQPSVQEEGDLAISRGVGCRARLVIDMKIWHLDYVRKIAPNESKGTQESKSFRVVAARFGYSATTIVVFEIPGILGVDRRCLLK